MNDVAMNDRTAYVRAKAIAEERLGRKLKPREYVHHKDGDVKNNTRSNLEVIAPEDPRSVYYTEEVELVLGGAEWL